VFDKYFSKITDFFSSHKRILISAIIALVILSAFGAIFIKYDNNIELMLPGDRDIVLSMRFLRQSHFSDKAVISLGLNNQAYGTSDLIAAAEQLSSQLDSPLISKVTLGFQGDNPQKQIKEFLNLSPQLIGKEELLKVDSQLNDSGINQALKSDYNKLLSPGGSFMLPFISLDPLGVKQGLLRRLNKMSNVLGQGIILEDGHFLSMDKRHTLLILDTKIPLTDGFGSRKLINFLREKLKTLPKFVNADIIAGHMHAVSNEDVIKNDIQRTVGIAMIAFLAVFLFTFKDMRAFIFLLIPLGAVIIALNISAFIFGRLSYFVIGLGAVIIGVADDYGIHTYVAVRTRGSRDAVKEIAKPLIIAALTTISVFVTFFFSSVKGYQQLALFSISTIILCLLFVLLVFPYFLKSNYALSKDAAIKTKKSKVISDKFCILLWVLSLAILVSFSFRLKFSSDITQLDGSTKEVTMAEDNFKRDFNRYENPAMLVVSNPDMEKALERNEEIYSQITPIIGEDNITSFTSLWPSLKVRKANAIFWNSFWRKDREQKLSKLLNKYSQEYGFSKDAFEPFFLNLYSGMDTENNLDDLVVFKSIRERFIQKDGPLWQVVSFFPDKDEFVGPVINLIRNNPDTLVVSRNAFSQEISDSVLKEIVRLSILAALLVLILTIVLLKDIKLTLISLVSVASAIISIAGVFAFLNKPINVAVIISSMMVIGLSIDYGVFMLYSFKHELNTGTVKAIWVSALTTLIGAFSLLFAKHPVLFSVGLTLVSGLASGYICSQTVIPALYRVFINKERSGKLIKTGLPIILIILICGCSSIPFKHSNYFPLEGADPEALRNNFALKLPREFEVLNSAVFRYRHLRFSALGVTRVDTDKKMLSTAGFNHLGVLLFDLSLNNGKIESRYIFPEFTKHGDFASVMLRDVKNIYFDRIPGPSLKAKKEKNKITFRENIRNGVLEYIFSGEGRFLAEKNFYESKKKIWSVSYYEYIFDNGKIYPKYIVLRHYKYKYDLIIKLKEIR